MRYLSLLLRVIHYLQLTNLLHNIINYDVIFIIYVTVKIRMPGKS